MRPSLRSTAAGTTRRATRRLVALAALGGALLGAGCSAETPSDATIPSTTIGRPAGDGHSGDLVESIEAPSVPGATTRRITYRSVDVHGRPSLATALVVTPEGAAPGSAVIAWGHPTTGTGDRCAPSRVGAPGIPNVEAIVARGWVIVATDYEGIGAAGPHPYLVSDSEARSVFDALGAATQLTGGGVASDAPVVLWGFSQGGHAVLSAAERAEELAPDVDLRGVAVAAAVSDVTGFLQRSQHPSQLGVAVAIAHGARLAAPELDPDDVFTPTGLELLEGVDQQCIAELVVAADLPVDDVLRADPAELPDWRSVLDAQRPGDDGVGVAVLVLHGADDEIIPVADSEALVARLCAAGDPVRFVRRAGDGHSVTAEPDLTEWIAERIAGTPPPSDCPRG